MTETFRFKLDDSFYQELYQRLVAKQGQERDALLSAPRRGWGSSLFQRIQLESLVPEKIPSTEMLRNLIETSFWTSLLREEGRELRFTIKYIHQASQDLPFKEPIDFNVSNLRKLAPALRNAEAGVFFANDGKLKIAEISSLITEPFAIKVLDPGMVIISLDYSNVAAVSGDEPVFIRNAHLSWSSDIWAIFGSNNETFFAFSDTRVRTVIAIAREMRLKGHGGALLIVLPNHEIERSISEICYEVSEGNRVGAEPLQELLAARRKLQGDKEDRFAKEMEKVWERQLLTGLPEFLAQLTLVDGATVLSSEFHVLGFGVRLKAANSAIPLTVVRIDPLEHEAELETAFNKLPWGTRHKSAAQFVFDNPGSIAIVVSQDGNVTAFVWRTRFGADTASLHAFERLELTLF